MIEILQILLSQVCKLQQFGLSYCNFLGVFSILIWVINSMVFENSAKFNENVVSK